MPFQQPVPMMVRQTHFRGKTFTFPVESILAANSKASELSIDASGGYLLTTSLNDIPQPRQTIPYHQQPDGSWLASATVHVTVTVTALVSGSITLEDSLGEMLLLPISIDSALFVDSTEISFDETKPGDSTATILTVRQRGHLTPVNLKVEPDEHFSIADAKMARITVSTLTLTPAFEGSNVIVNYRPNRAGRNTAQLTITTPYETKTVRLIGQPGGVLGWVRLPDIPQLVALPRPQLPELPSLTWPALPNRRLLITSAVIVAFGGVLWGAYSILARSENRIDLTVLSRPSVDAPAKAVLPIQKPAKPVERPVKPMPQAALVALDKPDSIAAATPVAVAKPAVPEPVVLPKKKVLVEKISTRTERVALVVPRQSKAVKPVVAVAAKATANAKPVLEKGPAFSINQVSELEKELNGPISLKRP